ncbi:hypothetical protein PVAND_009741 [Polypedilum vanderplanki]|uniref:Uncharacterized protein n=1 Tax=Polypedilum vanderplanki TaxID=319348 RepID=A0A9J6CEH0_POLVA|nr:hypothetical protein PVAND_009741 [Polypedilum vanderplanki]
MSFFSSLVANVTSGVANLGLGSRRFSLSRQDSNEGNVADLSGAKTVATPPSITVTSTSNLSTQHDKAVLEENRSANESTLDLNTTSDNEKQEDSGSEERDFHI